DPSMARSSQDIPNDEHLQPPTRPHRETDRDSTQHPPRLTVAHSKRTPDVRSENPSAARSAGLHYVADNKPGIRRTRSGTGFRYAAPNGSARVSKDTIERIRKLAIPPAWTQVWICPDPQGHLQATGRDARGRKQYRYHREWSAARNQTKYARLLRFGRGLLPLRKRARRDLALQGLPREKVLAAVVRLLETTLIR